MIPNYSRTIVSHTLRHLPTNSDLHHYRKPPTLTAAANRVHCDETFYLYSTLFHQMYNIYAMIDGYMYPAYFQIKTRGFTHVSSVTPNTQQSSSTQSWNSFHQLWDSYQECSIISFPRGWPSRVFFSLIIMYLKKDTGMRGSNLLQRE